MENMSDQSNPNRITINIGPNDSKLLTNLSERTEQNKTDVMIRGLRAYDILIEAKENDAKIALRYPDGREEIIRFL